MPYLGPQLVLERCPHCGVDAPSLQNLHTYETTDFADNNTRYWKTYVCSRCGGVVIAASLDGGNGYIWEMYPGTSVIDESIEKRAREYLTQCASSLNAPAGAVMLAASAVDAMLKAKGYSEGSLYVRIDKAKDKNLITEDMAKWAHDVRLDANEQRHVDEVAELPSIQDAKKSFEFALALAEFMFVLPARVTRGLKGDNGN